MLAVPQGSPLSTVLFLVRLAPILDKLEWPIVAVVLGIVEQFSFDVYDPHNRLYDERRR